MSLSLHPMPSLRSVSASAGSSSASIASGPTTPTGGCRVRFDRECTLIPARTHRPKALSKTYSLPLWKKKGRANSASDSEILESQEDSRVKLKVMLPSFMVKSRSPTRDNDAIYQPLTPCLVHHRESSESSGGALASPGRHPPPPPMRRPSLPGTQSLTTIPLRKCCPGCIRITEECLRSGDKWQEKFSRGARRRRSESLSQEASGFAAVGCPTDSPTVVSASYPQALTINVDEVDKRRKSVERLDEHMSARVRDAQACNKLRLSSLQADGSSSSLPEPKAKRCDYDDQLFPLPSPRRSPCGSPMATSFPKPQLPSRTPAPSRLGARGSELSRRSSDGGAPTGARRVKGLLTPDASPLPQSQEPFECADVDNSILGPSLSSKDASPTSTLSATPQPPIPILIPTKNEAQQSTPPLPAASLSSPPPSPVMVRGRPSVVAQTSSYGEQTSSSAVSSSPPLTKLNPTSSPPMKHRRLSSVLRVGADVLKGVGSIGSPGI